jgi:mannosyltransferase OCH1-like enzyme
MNKIVIIIGIIVIYKFHKKCLLCKKLDKYELSQINFTPKVYENFRAPKNIYQTWEDPGSIPKCCVPVIEKIRDNNPDWNYKLYNSLDRRNLIKDYFDPDVLKAYDSCKNKAEESDLFRYCVLYTYGGLYLDIKTNVLGNLNDLQDTLGGKLLYCKWPNKLNKCDFYNHAATSILLWPPKHPILYKLIDFVSRRILKFPNSCTTCIVGPNIYAMVITKYIPKEYMYFSDNYVNGFFEHDGTNGEYYNYVKSKKLHWSQNK